VGAGVGAGADVVGTVTVRVNPGIGSVGSAGVVGSVGALRSRVLVAVDGLLDLVDDARHVGVVVLWLFVKRGL